MISGGFYSLPPPPGWRSRGSGGTPLRKIPSSRGTSGPYRVFMGMDVEKS
jgi:hypothetical protein